MAARPVSVGPGSSNSSSYALPPIAGLRRREPHPEHWTLTKDWNIEKRELYEDWKMDVQNQIACMALNLKTSLNVHPHPDIGSRADFLDAVNKAWTEERKRQRSKKAENTLRYGLAKIKHPDLL